MTAAGEDRLDVEKVADVVARLRRSMRRSVRADIPAEALSVAQVEVMQLLADRPGLLAREVADRLLLAPTTVSTLIGQLLHKDLLLRLADSTDRRAWRLSLSQLGKETLEHWQQDNTQILRDGLGELTPGERLSIAAALPALERLVHVLNTGPQSL